MKPLLVSSRGARDVGHHTTNGSGCCSLPLTKRILTWRGNGPISRWVFNCAIHRQIALIWYMKVYTTVIFLFVSNSVVYFLFQAYNSSLLRQESKARERKPRQSFWWILLNDSNVGNWNGNYLIPFNSRCLKNHISIINNLRYSGGSKNFTRKTPH